MAELFCAICWAFSTIFNALSAGMYAGEGTHGTFPIFIRIFTAIVSAICSIMFAIDYGKNKNE